MQHALIVDDSRTSRLVLQQMLDKEHFEVDTVASGEQALDYLATHSPHVIFMDHIMPGMDGFQSVKAIKANSQTANIPIVMYTSKEGEVYVGQAHALGADDILAKPATASTLASVLARLHSQGKVARPRPPVLKDLTPLRGVPTVTDEHMAQELELSSAQRLDSTIHDPAPQNRALLDTGGARDHGRSTSAGLDTMATQSIDTPALGRGGHGPLRQLMAAMLLMAPVIWLAGLYFPAEAQRQALQAERQIYLKSIEWAINQAAEYRYGEIPLAGKRLALLEGLVAQLAAANYRGKIRIESHVGEFCLTELPSDSLGVIWSAAPGELQISACSAIGQSIPQSLEMSARQDSAFKQFVDTSPLLAAVGIDVEVIAFGASSPIAEYPDIDTLPTAAEWNRVAQQNNRVQFVLFPAAPEAPGSLWSSLLP